MSGVVSPDNDPHRGRLRHLIQKRRESGWGDPGRHDIVGVAGDRERPGVRSTIILIVQRTAAGKSSGDSPPRAWCLQRRRAGPSPRSDLWRGKHEEPEVSAGVRSMAAQSPLLTKDRATPSAWAGPASTKAAANSRHRIEGASQQRQPAASSRALRRRGPSAPRARPASPHRNFKVSCGRKPPMLWSSRIVIVVPLPVQYAVARRIFSALASAPPSRLPHDMGANDEAVTVDLLHRRIGGASGERKEDEGTQAIPKLHDAMLRQAPGVVNRKRDPAQHPGVKPAGRDPALAAVGTPGAACFLAGDPALFSG